jgi:hypothetical protein
MPTAKPRFTLTITDAMLERSRRLKKEVFYDRPYSEMYRELITLGLESMETKRGGRRDGASESAGDGGKKSL